MCHLCGTSTPEKYWVEIFPFHQYLYLSVFFHIWSHLSLPLHQAPVPCLIRFEQKININLSVYMENIYIYMYMCVYIYIYIYIYMYVYMYISQA